MSAEQQQLAARREAAADLHEQIMAALSELRLSDEHREHLRQWLGEQTFAELHAGRTIVLPAAPPYGASTTVAVHNGSGQPVAVVQPGQSVTFDGQPLGVLAAVQGGPPHIMAQIDKLAWLLGLSNAEREFVAECATVAVEGKPGEAYAPLMIFADWLEDQCRCADAESMRRLVPQTGDVITINVAYTNDAKVRDDYREYAEWLDLHLRQVGRTVIVSVLYGGEEVDIADDDRMRSYGWIRDPGDARWIADLDAEITGEPESITGRYVAQNAIELIRRLKQQIAELRQRLHAQANSMAACRSNARSSYESLVRNAGDTFLPPEERLRRIANDCDDLMHAAADHAALYERQECAAIADRVGGVGIGINLPARNIADLIRARASGGA